MEPFVGTLRFEPIIKRLGAIKKGDLIYEPSINEKTGETNYVIYKATQDARGTGAGEYVWVEVCYSDVKGIASYGGKVITANKYARNYQIIPPGTISFGTEDDVVYEDEEEVVPVTKPVPPTATITKPAPELARQYWWTNEPWPFNTTFVNGIDKIKKGDIILDYVLKSEGHTQYHLIKALKNAERCPDSDEHYRVLVIASDCFGNERQDVEAGWFTRSINFEGYRIQCVQR